MTKICEQLNLDPNSTEEQIVAAINALKANRKSAWRAKYLGHDLSPETAAEVDRRVSAGLQLGDAIAVQLAQEKHDAIGH